SGQVAVIVAVIDFTSLISKTYAAPPTFQRSAKVAGICRNCDRFGPSAAAEHLAVDHRHPAVRVARPLAPGIRDLLQLALSREALLECPIGERRLENSPRPHATPPRPVGVRGEAPDGCRALDLGESGFVRPRL